MKFKIFLFLFLFAFLLSGVSALVQCQPSTISQTFTQNILSTSQTTCTNDGNISVSISQIGTDFNLSDSSIGSFPSQKTLTISYNPSASIGLHSGSITFSDGSSSVPIAFQVNAPQQTQSDSGILIFPTSKVVTVQQGSEKSQSITLTVPSTYPTSITIQSVDFNPGTETISFGDLNLGLVSPGQ